MKIPEKKSFCLEIEEQNLKKGTGSILYICNHQTETGEEKKSSINTNDKKHSKYIEVSLQKKKCRLLFYTLSWGYKSRIRLILPPTWSTNNPSHSLVYWRILLLSWRIILFGVAKEWVGRVVCCNFYSSLWFRYADYRMATFYCFMLHLAMSEGSRILSSQGFPLSFLVTLHHLSGYIPLHMLEMLKVWKRVGIF